MYSFSLFVTFRTELWFIEMSFTNSFIFHFVNGKVISFWGRNPLQAPVLRRIQKCVNWVQQISTLVHFYRLCTKNEINKKFFLSTLQGRIFFRKLEKIPPPQLEKLPHSTWVFSSYPLYQLEKLPRWNFQLDFVVLFLKYVFSNVYIFWKWPLMRHRFCQQRKRAKEKKN